MDKPIAPVNSVFYTKLPILTSKVQLKFYTPRLFPKVACGTPHKKIAYPFDGGAQYTKPKEKSDEENVKMGGGRKMGVYAR